MANEESDFEVNEQENGIEERSNTPPGIPPQWVNSPNENIPVDHRLELPSQNYLILLLEAFSKMEDHMTSQREFVEAQTRMWEQHNRAIENQIKLEQLKFDLEKTRLSYREVNSITPLTNIDSNTHKNDKIANDNTDINLVEAEAVVNSENSQTNSSGIIRREILPLTTVTGDNTSTPSADTSDQNSSQKSHIQPDLNESVFFNNLNETFKRLSDSITSNSHANKVNIKRDYKLTQKSQLNIWMDYLKSELMSHDLLDVIDDGIPPPKKLKPDDILKRNNLVREIIINHLDVHYHKKVINISNAKEVLYKIKNCKKVEINVTDANIRAELYSLKKGKNEKIDVFSDKFDAILRKHESCDNAVPLSDVEKRSAFYNAVSFSCHELKTISLFRRQEDKEDLTVDEIKSFVLQLEAEKKREDRERSVAKPNTVSNSRGVAAVVAVSTPRHAPRWQSGPHANCFRCSQTGHKQDDCPLATSGRFYCYVCRTDTDHKGSSCPNNPNRYQSSKQGKFSSNINTNTSRTRGKGNFKRGNTRGRIEKNRTRVFAPQSNNPSHQKQYQEVKAHVAGFSDSTLKYPRTKLWNHRKG